MYVLSSAEPSEAPASATGEPGPEAGPAAQAAAPAQARDPLEDLLEPTPSGAFPELPSPGENPVQDRGCPDLRSEQAQSP